MKTILITGASKGIGKALAQKYGKEKNHLILLARNEEELLSLSQEIISFGGKAEFFICDVSNKNEIKSVLDKILASNKIDLAILNAGISLHSYFDDFDSENLLSQFNTNVFGVMYFIEILIPYFKKMGGGTIAAVSSLAEARGLPGSSIYCSTKIALSHLLEAARVELKQFGIKVITIKPGFVKTPMTDKNHFKMPLLISAEESADIITDGIEKGKRIIAFPKQMAFYSYLGKITPSFIFEKLISFSLDKLKK
jgi:short-subunit dehydrogenase